MLPADKRMRNARQFSHTVRHGIKVSRPTLVLHARAIAADQPFLAGFVVSKPVGNAVRRNTVKRRLRHLVAGLQAGVASDGVTDDGVGGDGVTDDGVRGDGMGSDREDGAADAGANCGLHVVIRALPAAGQASPQQLHTDLETAWARMRKQLNR